VDEQLSRDEIRARSLSGAALVAGRGVLLLVMAAIANVVLARQLSPQQFGLIAFGLAILSFASAMADGGLGSALIRSSVPIDKPILRSVLGLELSIGLALCLLIAAIALPFFGTAGQLTALMAVSLPLAALATPTQIVLERTLDYRTVARVEVLEAVAFYAFAVTAVSLGAGVWGLAAAALVRPASGYLLLVVARRDLFFFPLFSLSRVRPLLRFGASFQATSLVNVVRDDGLNVVVAALTSTTVLGLWTLARRLLELPMLLFMTLWRVSFPTMAQLIRGGSDVRPLIERAAAITSVGAGLVLVPLAACAPALVPAVFGERWHEAGVLVPIACAGLLLSGPISVATAGYLYAVGDAASVLRVTIAHTIAWIGVAAALLPVLGAPAIPLAWVLACIVDALLLARATQRRIRVRLFRATAKPMVAALVAAGVGVGYAFATERSLAQGVVSAVIAFVLYAVAVWLLDRRHTAQLVTAIGASVTRRASGAVVVQDG
jgi:O-antigen/teichoic acid export membrane protein